MKRMFTFVALLLWTLPALAQIQTITQAGDLKPIAREIFNRQLSKIALTESKDLFTLVDQSTNRVDFSAMVQEASVLELQPKVLKSLLAGKASNLKVNLPTNQGNLTLDLYEVNIYSEGFSVLTSDGKQLFQSTGKHYRGIINGNNQSLAAISIYDNEVMGLIINEEGNHTLGRLGKEGNNYVLYNDKNLKNFTPPQCFTREIPGQTNHANQVKEHPGARVEATQCVRMYWEADYPLFTSKGYSVDNVVNYLTGLFNQSKIIYDNDGITVSLAQIFVWTYSSPYGNGSSLDRLNNFRNYRTSFNGDLAHLLSYGGGGGIAYINALCNTGFGYGYSGIDANYNNFPTYSWNVMVVTHEQGHNMGSQHTHACAWNGNNTAIDNCWSTEGGCPSVEGASPAGGGTIMSYCHLTSTGINLSKGFGLQPRERIINSINSSSCLTGNCSGGNGGTTLVSGQIYRLVSRMPTANVLDVSGCDPNPGAKVQVWDWLGSPCQRWKVENSGDGFYKLSAIHSNGKVLDISGSRVAGSAVIQWNWNAAYWQQWKIEPTDGGYFSIRSRLNLNLGLDITGCSPNHGAGIQVWDYWGGACQQWKFELVGAGLPANTASSPAELKNEAGKLTVAPNPANEELRVTFYADEAKQVEITMYSIDGKKLHAVGKEASKGKNEAVVAVPSTIKPGLYIIEAGRERTKVIILR